MCSHMCALLCVLSCLLSYLLLYVCSHLCAPSYSHMYAPRCFHMCALICVLLCGLIYVLSCFCSYVLSYVCSHDAVSFFPIPPTRLFGVSCRDNYADCWTVWGLLPGQLCLRMAVDDCWVCIILRWTLVKEKMMAGNLSERLLAQQMPHFVILAILEPCLGVCSPPCYKPYVPSKGSTCSRPRPQRFSLMGRTMP